MTKIEVSQALAKLPGMEKSPWVMTELYGSRANSAPLDRPDAVGPWLRIEDGNPWSSAGILWRAGYDPRTKTLKEFLFMTWLEEDGTDLYADSTRDHIGEVVELLVAEFESSHALAVAKLHEIAPELYLRAMDGMI